MSVFIIAEAGVNHNGDMDMAHRLIDVAADAGADAVKFQTFKAENLATQAAPKAEYQDRTAGTDISQIDMLQQLEIPRDAHAALRKHAISLGLEFMSTPFDVESLRFLVEDLGIERLKIPSGELTNGPLLVAAGQSKAEIIYLSTGMGTLDEVREACGAIAFGQLGLENPSRAGFLDTLGSARGREILQNRVTVLQCTTEYPAPAEDANLHAMSAIAEATGVRVGYSDHTEDSTSAVAAVALGAVTVEKHFTLDKSLPGPDHEASLDPESLREFIEVIRLTETALGNGKKMPRPSEIKNIPVARKVIVATANIAVGDVFSEANLGALRAGYGLSPMKIWSLYGKTSAQSYVPGDVIVSGEGDT